MDISATAKYIRVTPRKLGLIAGTVKDLSPGEAITRLEFLRKSGAQELKQVIASALANSKNRNAAADTLFLKQIEVLPGGAMKRFRSVSRGMAHEYKKRMSHVRVVLTSKEVERVVADQKIEKKVKGPAFAKTMAGKQKSPPKADRPLAEKVKIQK